MSRPLFVLILISIVVIASVYGRYKPLPDGLDVAGSVHHVSDHDVQLLVDQSYIDDQSDTRVSEQEIFDEVLSMIDGAEEYILIDFFFYSDFLGTATTSYRALSDELTGTLIKKKTVNPNITIQVVTDPINILYGGYTSAQFEDLRAHDIPVTVTDLRALRDSNPLYSGFWRVALQWLPDSSVIPLFPHFLDTRKEHVGLMGYLNSFNLKANHRKVVVVDHLDGEQRGLRTLITSANPHDGSSAHSNIAVVVDGALGADVIESERAVITFSGGAFTPPRQELLEFEKDDGPVSVQLLTERAIKDTILSHLNSLSSGDSLDMLMFYLSDRDIVSALKRADERGATIRIVLDPAKDAFGRTKNGVPNRQTAEELMANTSGNTTLRWCNTRGEQCHGKMLLFRHDVTSTLIQGSANLTRRNLDDLNLEMDLLLSGPEDTTVLRDAYAHFQRVFNNEPGHTLSLPYDTYRDTTFYKKALYYFGELTGMSRY